MTLESWIVFVVVVSIPGVLGGVWLFLERSSPHFTKGVQAWVVFNLILVTFSDWLLEQASHHLEFVFSAILYLSILTVAGICLGIKNVNKIQGANPILQWLSFQAGLFTPLTLFPALIGCVILATDPHGGFERSAEGFGLCAIFLVPVVITMILMFRSNPAVLGRQSMRVT